MLKIRKRRQLTHPNEKGGTVATGGECHSFRSLTTPSSQLAVPSPPARYFKDHWLIKGHIQPEILFGCINSKGFSQLALSASEFE